jgi:hypothetical protein
MTGYPRAPQVLGGGLVLLDAASAAVRRVIVFQYNPDTLTRSFQVQGAGGEGGDRLEVLRLKGAPIETIKLEAEIDAADQLERPQGSTAGTLGIAPLLAALVTCTYPDSADVARNEALAAAGSLQILPSEAPLTLLIWGARRVVPVRIVELGVTEEAFDPLLNPLRAKVSLGLRVLSTNDVPRGHRAAAVFMAYHQGLERLAAQSSGTIGHLGLGRLP